MDQAVAIALGKIAQYRDRFSAGALIVGFVSVLMALWTTAPALDVTLPLVGGAKVGLNVGYVLMAGIPVITLALMWLTGPLLSMQRLQHAVLADVERHGVDLSITQRRELLGPFAPETTDERWASYAYRLSSAVRYFIFFMCPLLGGLWIAEEYFRHLHAYDREIVVDHTLREVRDHVDRLAPSDWRIGPKHKISVTEYLFQNKPRKQRGYAPDRFTIGNSDLERDCAQIWVLARLETLTTRGHEIGRWQPGLIEELTAKTKNAKCAVDGFPRFELALNSWLNVVSLLLSAWITSMAWRLYRSTPIARRLAALDVSHNNEVKARDTSWDS